MIVVAGSALTRNAINSLRSVTAAPIFIYDPEGGPKTIARVSPTAEDAFITSSAVELLSALTETRCGGCGLLLPEPGNVRADRRKPCPNCGSLSRAFVRTLSGTSTSVSSGSGRLTQSDDKAKE